MGSAERFGEVFDRLKTIMDEHEAELKVEADEAGNYVLYAAPSERDRKGVFFGAVQARKRYVSYHLMPVYMYPDLLDEATPELKRRMQGKSCFNFTRIDDERFEELGVLTKRGFERFKQEKIL